MKYIKDFRHKRVSENATVEDFLKELTRKSIHIFSAISVFFAHFFFIPTVCLLGFGLLGYVICEVLRLQGIRVPVISHITQCASRVEDEGRFVLGPVTLVLGIILALFLFTEPISTVAIFSLSFGDGFASLIGKIYGVSRFKIIKQKTLLGSFSCFCAVFVSTFFVLKNLLLAFFIAIVATLVEVLPLKNFDNIVIPVIVGIFTSFIV